MTAMKASPCISQSLFKYTWLSMVGTALLDPVFYNFTLKRSNISPDQQKTLMVQELVHQGLNIAIELASFLLFGKIIGALLKNHPKKDYLKFIAGTAGLFAGKAVLRPIATLKITDWWQRNHGSPNPPKPAIAPTALYSPSSVPLRPAVESPYANRPFQTFTRPGQSSYNSTYKPSIV